MIEKTVITIFTATYNRAALLPVLFASLKIQTSLNFEWIIVDDGSTDNTEQVIAAYKKEASFNIIYHKQQNQGKHIAINKGLELANGNYFYIVDSDDRLPEKSIEIINKKIKLIENEKNIAGVVGLKCYFDATTVGSKDLKENLICSHLEHRFKYNYIGDRAEVIKTKVFREFLFPKYGTENFVPESIVWNRIAQKYKMLFFPENVYECEYLEDGLSFKSIKLRRKNPIGISILYKELGNTKSIGFLNRSKVYINFWRFFWCLPNSIKLKHFFYIKNHLFTFFCLPIGTLIYLKDSFSK